MRKRILSVVLVAVMCVSMVACNKSADKQEKTTTAAASEKTVGQTLLGAFKEKAADSKATSQDIVDALLENKIIDFAGASMPVEEGLLTGFDNTEIKGFKDGVQFAPMIGAIPFVGYVFTVDSDADAFMKTLKDNANPRWNVCTEADETVCEKVGDKVLFLMCPKSFTDGQ